jgi:hypothetical protein
MLLINNQADCQVFGNLIERTIQPTVLIKIGPGLGSGILVFDSTKLSLVTAKHVIFDPNQNFTKLNSNQLTIQFYLKDFRKNNANFINVDLNTIISNDLLLSDSLIDICVIKLASIDTSGKVYYYKGISSPNDSIDFTPYLLEEDRIIKKNDLYLGEDVFIVGFPNSIGLQQSPQFDYDRPLLKRGSIASLSDNFNTFIIDCSAYQGNSGGHVFLERKSFDKYSLRLIGIVTQFIPVINPTMSKKDLTIQYSSYAVVVPIEYALKLLNDN